MTAMAAPMRIVMIIARVADAASAVLESDVPTARSSLRPACSSMAFCTAWAVVFPSP